METIKIKGYIARDEGGELNLFSVKPERKYLGYGDRFWDGEKPSYRYGVVASKINLEETPYDINNSPVKLKWEDEPLEVEVTITINKNSSNERKKNGSSCD